MNKRTLQILLLFFAIIALPAPIHSQTIIKGIVTWTETQEPVSGAKIYLADSTQINTPVSTDILGCYTIKNVEPGKYTLFLTISDKDTNTSKPSTTEIKITHKDGFTVINLDVDSNGDLHIKDIPIIEIGESVTSSNSRQKYDKKTIKLNKYKINDSSLYRLLDRVVERKENSYEYVDESDPLKLGKRMKRGTTCVLNLIIIPALDTSSKEFQDSYWGYIHRCNPNLPIALDSDAKPFRFDHESILINITTSYRQGKVNEAYGYVKYRGCYFFLDGQDTDNHYFQSTRKTKKFEYLGPKSPGIWDPPTWMYSYSEGHWYRWMELPLGF